MPMERVSASKNGRNRPYVRRGSFRGARGKTNEMRPIWALDTPNYVLISFDSDEVAHIGDNLGIDLSGFDGALVDASDGDYNEVWVFRGVPNLEKYAERVR